MEFKDQYFISDFLGYMKSIKGCSENTVRSYHYDLRTFLKFIAIRYQIYDNSGDANYLLVDLNLINNVKINDLHAFISYADKDLNNSNYGKFRKVAVLHSFYDYLLNKVKLISNNPAAQLEFPKIDSRLPIYMTLEQAEYLLDTILKEKNPEYRYRDYAIIMIFLNCGLRLSELSSINIDSINEDRTLTVIGKGNKERLIYLNETTYDSIKTYIKHRTKDLDENEKALFISKKRNRMSNRAIQYMLDKYLNKASLNDKNFTIHKLRHTAATLMYKYGKVDIRTLQEVLGHSSVSTTQIYTHLDDEQIKRAIDKNPLAQRKSDNEI